MENIKDASGIPRLMYYALKALFTGLDTEAEEDTVNLHLPDFEDIQRLPYDPSLSPLLYQRRTTINTSPLHWIVLCRLFTSLPDDLRIFHLPLSDPYILPLQSWNPLDGIGVQFITTVSLGRHGGDSIIPVIAKLTSLVALDLSGSSTTTTGIRQLSTVCGVKDLGPRKLAILMLTDCPITNAILEPLKVFKMLQYIGEHPLRAA